MAACLLLVAAVVGAARSDVSSVDVFTHGEHPLCTCLRIPSVVATTTHLYAFAECRSWRGDGCDPMAPSSSTLISATEQGGTNIAMKTSADGGEHWSELQILTAGGQPTALFDAPRDTLLFMFKSVAQSGGAVRLMTKPGGGNWSQPRVVVPVSSERNQRPMFPGPGNAIMLSADHPSAPGRLLFPCWLGPDGATTSASLFFSDDGGKSFNQTLTSWPHDGNDESTVVELADGEVLYITRSNTSPCTGGGSTSRCLELARSTDGGTSFAAVGRETVNHELAGPPCQVSALAVIDSNASMAHNYFRTNWRPCSQSDGGWATDISVRSGSTFVIVAPASSDSKGRQSWPNVTIGASATSKIFLEGPGSASKPPCYGNPDYSSVQCNSHYPTGSTNVYTSTCFDLLPLSPTGSGVLRYGSPVVLREPGKDGGSFLNPLSGAFDTQSRASAGWTLVSVAAPQTGVGVFTGEAFALRPGVHPPPYTPPPPPRLPTRPNRTLYLSHPENLAMTGRTNGTVRASTDGGKSWPWTFQATLDLHPNAGSVFSRQAFGYSCLTAMPPRETSASPFDDSKYVGLLWESSSNDCTGTDASCSVKFSVVPMIPPSARPTTDTPWVSRGR